MATVNMRESPRTGEKFWQLSYVENGLQRRESLGPVTGATAKSAREVELLRKAKEIELEGGPTVFVPAASFDAHLAEYLGWHAAEYPASHFRVASIADNHFATFKGQSLAKIDAPMIEKWKAKRRAAGAKASTVGKEFRTLKAVLQKAVDWAQGLKENPAALVEAPKILRSSKLKYYSVAQLGLLYALPLHGATWKLTANTGMRRGELRKGRWGDVDYGLREIEVESTEDERTKSGLFRRIPLNDNALDALAQLRARYGKATPHPTDYIIPRIAASSLTRAFKNDVVRVGLPLHPGSLVHILRHCYGAHMHMGGVAIRDLKELMGHAHIETTMIYAGVTIEHLHKVALAVNL